MRKLIFACLLFPFLAWTSPNFISYQGRLFDNDGEPLNSGSVSLVLSVLDPSQQCVLRQESHTLDMANTSGFFSVSVGNGAPTTSSPNFTLTEVFSNVGILSDTNLGCAGNSYTPQPTDHRRLRVSINGEDLVPDQVISSVPFSIGAANLGGVSKEGFLQVDSSNLTQAKVKSFFDVAATLNTNQSLRWNSSGAWEAFTPGAAGSGVASLTLGNGLSNSGTTNDPIVSVNLGSGLTFNSGQVQVNQSAIDYNNLQNRPSIPSALSDLTGNSDNITQGTTQLFMTSAERSKLSALPAGAEVNVQADWNESSSSSDAFIANKPAIPGNITDLTVGADAISGNAVHGGTFSDFSSVGIDDNASATAVTIDSAGNVGLGTTTPDISALLDISSSTKGFLPPRMTRAERDAIGSPVVGLQIYNTTDKKLNLYDGSAWDEVGGESNNGLSPKSIYQWPSAVPELASAPASPTIGDAYYDTTDNKLFVYSSATWLEVDNSDGTIKYCTENDNCTGTVKFCRVTTPDTNVVVQTPTYDLLFGSWSNSQCGISGSGWHVGGSGVSSCSTGAGTKHGRCLWVLVDDPGLSSVKTIISDTDDDTMVQAEESADEDIIRFDTDGSERMVINASGNVGIGTASPAEKLDVSGTVKATAFEGDGSNLTNISAAAIADNSITVGDLDFASSNGINIPQLASDPGSPTTGQMYFNTTTNKMMVYNGSSWNEIASQSSGIGPSFRVNKNGANQSITANGTARLVTWGAEVFDTNDNFDLSTERFTPQVAGKYVVSASVAFDNTSCSSGNRSSAVIRKNGSTTVGRSSVVPATGSGHTFSVSAVVDMNGTTDYLDVTADSTSCNTIMASSSSFSGSFLGGSGGSFSNLSDATINNPSDSQILTYDSGSGKWINKSINASAAKTVETSWPDAIKLERTTGAKVVFYPTHFLASGGAMYELTDNDASQYSITYSADGSYSTSSNVSSLTNLNASEYQKSISTLYSEGKAFNFVGGGLNTASTTSAIKPGWPDSLFCGNYVFDLAHSDGTSATYRYKHSTGHSNYVFANTSTAGAFGTTGTLQPSVDATCTQTISQVISVGRANFYGNDVGSVAQDDDNDTKVMVEKSSDEDIIRFDTAGTERMVINNFGNVGIGTTSPNERLEVSGNIRVSGASAGASNIITTGFYDSSGTRVGYVGDGNGGNSDLYLGADGTNNINLSAGGNTRVFIEDTGDVGIGTTSPDQKLSVNGNASKVGGGSWATFSDRRLKTVHGPFVRGLKELLQLRAISYNYNEDNPLGLPNEKDHIGFVAQEVEALIPEAISKNKEGYLMVDNDPIIWTMLNAVKEVHGICEMSEEQLKSTEAMVIRNQKDNEKQDREIASLKAENAELKKQLGDQNKRLEALEKILSHSTR